MSVDSSVRETSLLSFFGEVVPSLGARQELVCALLSVRGPLSNAEIARELELSINSVTPRVNELRKLGRVLCLCGSFHLSKGDRGACAAVRLCTVTGRVVHVWRVV